MYLRKTRRKNKDGSVVEYLQLAHDYRDRQSGYSKPTILDNFGRCENIDVAVLRRLVETINRFVGPEDELPVEVRKGVQGAFEFIQSRPIGGAWLLHGLWHRLGIGEALRG